MQEVQERQESGSSHVTIFTGNIYFILTPAFKRELPTLKFRKSQK